MQNDKLEDDASREHPPKDAIEISDSDIEEKLDMNEILDNEIKPNNNFNQNTDESKNKQLLNKIKEQEYRLNYSNEFIQLCEKKIALIEPKQIFPLKDTDLLNNEFLLKIQETNKNLNKKNRDLIAITEQLKKDYLNITNKNINYQNEITTLSNELIHLSYNENKESKEIKEEYCRMCDLNTILNDEKVLLLNDIEALKDKQQYKDNEINNCYSLINQLKYQHQENKGLMNSEIVFQLKKEFNYKIENLSNIIQEKETTINNLKANSIAIENELFLSQSFSRNIELQFNALSSNIATQNEINETLQLETYNSLTELKNKNALLNENLFKSNEQITNMKKEAKVFDNKYNMLKDKYDELYQRFNQLKQNNSQLQGLNNGLNETKFKLEIQYNKLFSEMKIIQDDCNSKIKTTRNDYEDLKKEKDMLIQDSHKYKIEKNILNEDIKKNRLEINSLQAKIKEMKCDTDNIIINNTNIESQIKDLKQINKNIQIELSNVKEQLSNATISVDSLKNEDEGLKNKTTQLVSQIEKNQFDINERDNQLGNIIEMINKCKLRLLDSNSEKAKESNDSNKEQQKSFEENYITVFNYISWLIKEIEISKVDNSTNLLQITDLTLLNEKITKENSNNANENKMLKLQIQKFEKLFSIGEREKGDLKKEIKEYIFNIDKLKEQIKQLNLKYKLKKEMNKEAECKKNILNDRISLYENIKKGYEAIILKLMHCGFYNHNLSTLVNSLIRANFDLITKRNKEGNNETKEEDNNAKIPQSVNDTQEWKLKEISNLHNLILTELKADKRLLTNQTTQETDDNYNTVRSTNLVMKNRKNNNKLSEELSLSINKLRSSYLIYKADTNK